MNRGTGVIDNSLEVLTELRSKVPVYHMSNIFFRDIQYGIQSLVARKGQKIGYAQAEKLAREFVMRLEREKILVPVDRQTWVVRHPLFKTPSSVKAESAAKTTPKPPSPGGVKAQVSNAPPHSSPASAGE